ncbi:MAG: hypothetical protein NC338_04105 [Firmicutes bacterium]|nr:hypothetical protein [Bacillota bacterium]MCM1476510.1 hypothetical protein [Bacteroides sp.]
MKKLLLSILSLVACFVVSFAQTEVSFDFMNETYGFDRLSGTTNEFMPDGSVVKNGAVSITTHNASGGNGFRFWSDGFRGYSGSYLVISVPDGCSITNIEMTGTLVFAGNAGGGTAVLSSSVKWSGNSQSISLYVTGASAKKPVKTMKVTYTGTPTTVEPEPAKEYKVTYTGVHGAMTYTAGTETAALGDGVKFEEGTEVTFTLTPDEGFSLKSVMMNETDVTSEFADDNQYTVTVNEAIDFTAQFSEILPPQHR